MAEIIINGQYNSNLTIAELKELLLQGNEDASDLLWVLTKADSRKAWDYVGIEQVEHYMDGGGFESKPEDVLDYLKDDYELIDADAEIRHALESIDED